MSKVENKPDFALAEHIVECMNDLFCNDPTAIQALMEHRVPCNEDLAKHPVCQVLLLTGCDYRVGLLGVLNALCGVDDRGTGPVAANYEDTFNVESIDIKRESAKLLGFCINPECGK